jgi:hypothetical protein
MLSEKGDGKLIKWEKEQEWQRLNAHQQTKPLVIALDQQPSGLVNAVKPTTRKGEEWGCTALTITGEENGE